MDGDSFGSNLPRCSVPHRPSPWDFAAKELTNPVKDDKRVTPMYYIFGSTIHKDFMRGFVNNSGIDRLTRYGETYGELLIRSKIMETILSMKVFENAAREVIMNPVNPKFGNIALE
ncbi:hypothetical protein Tco_0664175 [Tanacetum coccineum]